MESPSRTSDAGGSVIWFTGLPCAGKTTLSKMLAAELVNRRYLVHLLDGDTFREAMPRLGFTKQDREENVRRVVFVADAMHRQGITVIAAFVSPYRRGRETASQEIARYFEIYVKCELQECIRRDVKGLYKKAMAGEIANFTGISDPYEPPERPDVTVETDLESPQACLSKILTGLEARGFVMDASA